MGTTQSKVRPFHIVLIALMTALSIVIFLYKDKIIPNQNAAYEELYSTFLQAEGTVTSFDNTGHGRRSMIIYTIQFRDMNDNLITVTETNWQTSPLKNGDKVIMYYNPQKPREAIPEKRWKEVMGK